MCFVVTILPTSWKQVQEHHHFFRSESWIQFIRLKRTLYVSFKFRNEKTVTDHSIIALLCLYYLAIKRHVLTHLFVSSKAVYLEIQHLDRKASRMCNSEGHLCQLCLQSCSKSEWQKINVASVHTTQAEKLWALTAFQSAPCNLKLFLKWVGFLQAAFLTFSAAHHGIIFTWLSITTEGKTEEKIAGD